MWILSQRGPSVWLAQGETDAGQRLSQVRVAQVGWGRCWMRIRVPVPVPACWARLRFCAPSDAQSDVGQMSLR